MTAAQFRALPRSERAKIERFEINVWPIGEGARYSVLDTDTGHYIKGGKCASLEWAKEVSTGFVRSLLSL